MKCCDMTSGMLRTPVQLQSETRTADGGGGFTRTWSTYATPLAHVTQTGGSERFTHERLSATTILRAVIRYRSDVQPQHRAVIRGKTYQIRQVNDVEFRRKWLELALEGGVAT